MSKKTNFKRIDFATSKILEYPDLLEVQLKSFKDFFQTETTPDSRRNEGLFKVFQEIFPIEDTRNNYKLEFIDYFIDPPQYSIEECLERGLTYNVPLKAKLRLSCTDPDHEDFDTRVQDVYLGNIPYMTPGGTFVINGSERIIVSQLHRSPGVFFDQSMHSNGTKLYSARIIPFKGSWIEFATDINNVMYAYIDRKKKLPVTTLLRAIGYNSDKDIIDIFGLADEISADEETLRQNAGRALAAKVLKTWTEDFEDEDTGEVIPIERTVPLVERGEILDDDTIERIADTGVSTILLQKDEVGAAEYSIIFNTLQKDPTPSRRTRPTLRSRQSTTSTSNSATANRRMSRPHATSSTSSSSPRSATTSALSDATVSTRNSTSTPIPRPGCLPTGTSSRSSNTSSASSTPRRPSTTSTTSPTVASARSASSSPTSSAWASPVWRGPSVRG